MNFSKKQYRSQESFDSRTKPPGTGAADPRGIYRPLQIHRRGPHGAVRHPRQHHHGAGHPRVRLRQQLAVAAIEQPFRHQVQAQLDGRQGLLRRRRQGECFRSYPRSRRRTGIMPNFDSQPRYDSLFAYSSDDYKSWARGSKPPATPRHPTTRSGSRASSRRTSFTCSTGPTASGSTPRAWDAR